MNDAEHLPLEIDVHALRDLRQAGDDLVLLDIREQDERDLVHIAGSRFLPMSQIQARVDELTPFREQRLVVHCHHGGRSERVTHWLRSKGFPRAQNLVGGIDAWAVHIDSTLPRY